MNKVGEKDLNLVEINKNHRNKLEILANGDVVGLVNEPYRFN